MNSSNALIIVIALFIGLGLVELKRFGSMTNKKATRKDRFLDLLSTLTIPGLMIPMVLYAAMEAADFFWPSSKDRWAHLTATQMFLVFLIADDLIQYFWHRLSHNSWLFPFHRAHHSAGYLSVTVVYRNHLLYYGFMPNLWLTGMMLHFGLTPAYPLYVVIKMCVIISAHSSVPWDSALYNHPITKPIMWLIERVISTPSTHSMHHGLHEKDGITHYKGNYGNLLFLWDVLFGTAQITRKRPREFGVEDLEPTTLTREFLWYAPSEETIKLSSNKNETDD